VTGTPGPQVHVFRDPEALSLAAADLFVNLAQQSIAKQGRFAVALSGGSSPKRLYVLLGSLPHRDAVSWPQVHFFWADERCVPPDHPESNYKLAFDTLLSNVPVPEANVHRMKGEEEPGNAAKDYEEALQGYFRILGIPAFDLIILGVGEDGHTASLFPGSPVLREATRLVFPVYLERPKRDRVTLTLPVLNEASHILFLASGRTKAGVVSGIIDGNNQQHYPAGLVRPANGEVVWFIDREAAEKLRAPVRS
jgi:6-phosphogluconolactonase